MNLFEITEAKWALSLLYVVVKKINLCKCYFHSQNGATPLMLAAAYGHTSVVETLLRRNASPFCTCAVNQFYQYVVENLIYQKKGWPKCFTNDDQGKDKANNSQRTGKPSYVIIISIFLVNPFFSSALPSQKSMPLFFSISLSGDTNRFLDI